MMGMGYPDEGGNWNFMFVKCDEPDPDKPYRCHYYLFSEQIQDLMNEGFELHGTPFVHNGDLLQAMMRFEYPECEKDGGDDDDGLPLPEAGNEPIEQVRNCS